MPNRILITGQNKTKQLLTITQGVTYRREEHVGDIEAHHSWQIPNHNQQERGVPKGTPPVQASVKVPAPVSASFYHLPQYKSLFTIFVNNLRAKMVSVLCKYFPESFYF